MKMMNVFLAASMVLGSFCARADVSTANGFSKIKVSSEGQSVKFEYCQAGTSCRTLGPKKSYSIQELKDRRFHEALEIGYAGGADVGIGVAAAISVFVGWSFYMGTMGSQIPTVVTLLYAPKMAAKINVLNPMEQLRQMDTLSSKVIEDSNYQLQTEEDIFAFAKRLELVLNKISK